MKKHAAGIAAAAFAGMVDALLLAAMRGENVPCSITGGCDIVLKSTYSAVAGIPLPYFGLAFYLLAFSLAVFELTGSERALDWLFLPSILGFAITVVLLGIQGFVLHAWCQYCLLSAALTVAIFVLSVLRRFQSKRA
jgi:uncharacterized membrane protein